VQRLALACTSAGGEGGSSYPLHRLFELPPEEQAAASLKLVDSRWDDEWLGSHPWDRTLAQRLAAGAENHDQASPEARRAQLDARSNHDVWNRLGAIDCPTLVAGGRYDGIAPAQNSEAIASRIRSAELRIFEGGHAFLFQDPEAVPALISFLRGQAG
jgi:3-oxoadipate enol-lactonase